MHMYYTGTLLADGSKFDSCLDRGGSSDAVSVLTKRKPDVLCCSEVASEEAIIFCRNKLSPTQKMWMLLAFMSKLSPPKCFAIVKRQLVDKSPYYI